MSDELIDTGLLSLAPAPNAAPPAVPIGVPVAAAPAPLPIGVPVVAAPAPVPATQMPAGWTIQKVASLVRDLSTNMYELPFVLKTHGLSQAQYDTLAASDAFQSALRAMTVEWNTIGNTQKRLALEAAIYLEDALPSVAARLSKATEPLAGVVELAKLLAKMAGVGEVAQTNAPTERFKITINLGADISAFEKSRTPVTIRTIGEGTGDAEPIQPLLQGP